MADRIWGRWKGDSLQRAMDKSECFYDGCGSIKKQAMSEANKCTVQDFVKENIDGCMWLPPFREVKQDINAVLSNRAKVYARHGRRGRRKGQEVFYRLSPFRLCSCFGHRPALLRRSSERRTLCSQEYISKSLGFFGNSAPTASYKKSRSRSCFLQSVETTDFPPSMI